MKKLLTRWEGQSIARRIFSATLLIAVVSVMAKLGSIFKEVMVANYFGTSDALDAFLIGYLVATFLFNLIVTALMATVVPIYAEIKQTHGEEASKAFVTSLISWTVILLVILTVIAIAPAKYYLPYLASGFSPEKLALTLKMIYFLSPLIVINGLAALFNSILNANKSFIVPAIIPAITPLVIVVSIVFIRESIGIYALALGLLTGQIIELVIFWRQSRIKLTGFKLTMLKPDQYLGQAARQFLPMMAGALVMGSNHLIDQIFAASLSPGSVAVLSYGNRLVSFPMTLAAGALGTAVLPYFSEMVANNDRAGMQKVLKKYLALIFLTTLPVVALIVIFSEPIVNLLLARGAFTAQDGVLVAQIQAMGVLQVPFYLGSYLIVRGISSMQSNQTLMWISGLSMVVNVVCDYLFIKWFGISGIALSTSAVYFVSFTVGLLAFRALINRSSR